MNFGPYPNPERKEVNISPEAGVGGTAQVKTRGGGVQVREQLPRQVSLWKLLCLSRRDFILFYFV